MNRSDPVIDRMVAVTGHGTEVAMTMSLVIAQFGLRFSVVGLPDGEAPSRLRAERDGTVVADVDIRMPPPFIRPPGRDRPPKRR